MSKPQECPQCGSSSIQCVSGGAGATRESWRCDRGHSFVVQVPANEAARPAVQKVVPLYD